MNYGASINYLPELTALAIVAIKIFILCWLFASVTWLRERNRILVRNVFLKESNEQLQRGLDAAEGDRNKASMDAARLQVRCADLETSIADLSAQLDAGANAGASNMFNLTRERDLAVGALERIERAGHAGTSVGPRIARDTLAAIKGRAICKYCMKPDCECSDADVSSEMGDK